jgi:hypothetical protein
MSTWLEPKTALSVKRLLEVASMEKWRVDTSNSDCVVIWPFANIETPDEDARNLGIVPEARVVIDVDPENNRVVGCTAYHLRYAAVIAVVEVIHHKYEHAWWSEHEMQSEFYENDCY